MHSARVVLRLLGMRLSSWPHRSVSWIGLAVGCNFAFMPAMALLRSAAKLGGSVQLAEAYIIAGSDHFCTLLTAVGLIIMLSDAPFIDERIAFIGVRVSRRQWMAAHIAYVAVICALYQLIMFLFTAIVLSARAYVGNVWSATMLNVARGSLSLNDLSFRFSAVYLLRAYAPYQLLGVTFVLQTLYGAALSLAMFFLGLVYRRGVGIAAALCAHQMGFILLRSGPLVVNQWLSPMVHALAAYHDVFDRAPKYPTIPASVGILSALALGAAVLCRSRAKKLDYAVPHRDV